jgi:predicted metal-dependent HD superfamily phosphohydrolase
VTVALAESWAALAGRGEAAEAAGADLLRRWAEPHRRYHDLAHLGAVLARVEELAAYARDLRSVRLAVWFHDAVYDPARTDNEDASARLAEHVLASLGLPVAEVPRLVRLTATHAPAADDADGGVLCDADLAVLAGGPEEYAGYAAAVREEYGAVADAAFAAGRARVLRALLDRPRLFHTPAGRERWEAAARRNVETELTLLRAGAGGAAPPTAAG